MKFFAQDLTLDTRTEPPRLYLDLTTAQNILDMLWKWGFRPTEEKPDDEQVQTSSEPRV